MDRLEKEFINNKEHTANVFLNSMIQINSIKYDTVVIERLIALIEKEMIKEKHLENKKKLYLIFDSLLLNAFDLLEDFKKESIRDQLSFEEEEEKMKIKNYINKTL